MRLQRRTQPDKGVPVFGTAVMFGLVFFSSKFCYERNILAQAISLRQTSESLADASKEGTSYKQGNGNSFPTLAELTQNPSETIECPPPLMPLYDRIVPPSTNDTQKIPKIIHLAWIRGYHSPYGRCLSLDQLEIAEQWKKQFPSYSLYFHDDKAVDALFNQHHSHFPELAHIMDGCVKYGSAMRIDIWRQLVLYYYGGFYSDMDAGPGPKLTEALVQPEDTGFFLSDVWFRPSQWLFGLEVRHPIAYLTMREIFKRNLESEDISTAKLVFLTGPETLKVGYAKFILSLKDAEASETVFNVGTHTGMLGKQVRKLEGKTDKGMVFITAGNMVPYPRNGTNAKMITVKERIEKEMNTVHWKQVVRQKKEEHIGVSCWHSLFMMDNNLTSIQPPINAR